jgi:hypothetical protein
MQRGGLNKARDGRDDLSPVMIGHAFEIATATARRRSTAPQGYPLPTSKKKRACVVTYRHSGEQLFENSFLPRSNINNL